MSALEHLIIAYEDLTVQYGSYSLSVPKYGMFVHYPNCIISSSSYGQLDFTQLEHLLSVIKRLSVWLYIGALNHIPVLSLTMSR